LSEKAIDIVLLVKLCNQNFVLIKNKVIEYKGNQVRIKEENFI